MTITRSRIVAGASGICGEPTDSPMPEGIPHWLRYETAADMETDMLRDLALSVENRTLSSATVSLSPGNQEFVVDIPDFETPAGVDLKLNPADVFPIDVEITNNALINGKLYEGKRAVAFYSDHPQQGRVSWIPLGTEVLRLWYDRSPQTDPNPDTATMTITNSYLPLLKLLLAAQFLEFLGRTPGPVLQSRIARGLEQWEKFVRMSRQQNLVEKTDYRKLRGQGSRGIWTTADGFLIR